MPTTINYDRPINEEGDTLIDILVNDNADDPEDIFADDRSTFALEQLTKQFNTKIFVFGKLREADKAALLADNEIYRGIQKGSARLLDTWSDLNPPKPKKKEKLGEA